MKSARSAVAVYALLAFVGAGVAQARNHHPCSNATIKGNYAFTINGQILAPARAAGLVSGVALTHFDGQGNMDQIDHVVHNGRVPVEEWRPGSGPYVVNSDCTGWMTITTSPTNPQDGGPVLKLEFVVASDGGQIRTVVSGSPSSPAFTSQITSIGTRVHQWQLDLH